MFQYFIYFYVWKDRNHLDFVDLFREDYIQKDCNHIIYFPFYILVCNSTLTKKLFPEIQEI